MSTQQQPDTGTLHAGDLLDEKQTAAILCVTISTLRNWRWKREGPRFRKVGSRLVRYHCADLQAFIEGKEAA